MISDNKKTKIMGRYSPEVLCMGDTGINAESYPEMVTVEGGTFTMGDAARNGKKDARPLHQVSLNSFEMAKTPTTVAQWKTFCSATGHTMPENAPGSGWIDNHPIEKVNWQDAMAYCAWLSQKTNSRYRLPTEAEWEYAARGGRLSKGFPFSGGGRLDKVGWFENNSENKAHPVATKKPNELGLYDMSGNVWEWCSDWYGEYAATGQTNPQGPDTGTYRVLRGGGSEYSALSCRVACRFFGNPEGCFFSNGFRVALSL